jgi:hypothetical protein
MHDVMTPPSASRRARALGRHTGVQYASLSPAAFSVSVQPYSNTYVLRYPVVGFLLYLLVVPFVFISSVLLIISVYCTPLDWSTGTGHDVIVRVPNGSIFHPK